MGMEKSPTRTELTTQGPVAIVTFSNSSGPSVLSSHVLGDLTNITRQLAANSDLRLVVFRGSGKIFLAGADIAEMARFTEDQGQALSRHGHAVFQAIEDLPQVTIAALNGHTLGGGCELALACDFRILTASARIGQPESRLGLIPGWGGTQRLPRVVGQAEARKLLFSGAGIDAREALRIHLVDEVVESTEALDAAVERWFHLIKPGSPAAIRRIKHALRYHDETNQFGLCFSCSDAQEGMSAFLEKRSPAWTEQ